MTRSTLSAGAAIGAGAVTFAFLNTDPSESYEVAMGGSNPDGENGWAGAGS